MKQWWHNSICLHPSASFTLMSSRNFFGGRNDDSTLKKKIFRLPARSGSTREVFFSRSRKSFPCVDCRREFLQRTTANERAKSKCKWFNFWNIFLLRLSPCINQTRELKNEEGKNFSKLLRNKFTRRNVLIYRHGCCFLNLWQMLTNLICHVFIIEFPITSE